MISPAPTPSPVNPRIRSLVVSNRAFKNPRVSERVRARKFASIGTLKRRYGMPCACASISLTPMRASSGSVKRQYGTCRPLVTRLPPVKLAWTTRKSSTLMCVNCGLPATSPIAQMFGAVVWSRSLTLIYPRSVSSTPANSIPSPSVFGMRPMATRR